MTNPLHITIRNDFAEIAKAHAAVETFCAHFHISQESEFAINLALDELLANIINYAYSDSNAHVIAVTLHHDAVEARIVIVDDGNAFNPFEVPPPDLDVDIEDRPVGGLGIHLVKNVMSALEYKRTNGKNVVILTRGL